MILASICGGANCLWKCLLLLTQSPDLNLIENIWAEMKGE
ncbi:hypothetical protein PHPALM_30715 [Phytophthora palmivora]|uniref:Uncharacterized protein n=1 Tax=Phytophthora palmivora TaxID=4796 RepID=A0A2P4X4G6_9STRA|nr:hypothetical protein PHPALM_30715 [Phytophthora palmivora]